MCGVPVCVRPAIDTAAAAAVKLIRYHLCSLHHVSGVRHQWCSRWCNLSSSLHFRSYRQASCAVVIMPFVPFSYAVLKFFAMLKYSHWKLLLRDKHCDFNGERHIILNKCWCWKGSECTLGKWWENFAAMKMAKSIPRKLVWKWQSKVAQQTALHIAVVITPRSLHRVPALPG